MKKMLILAALMLAIPFAASAQIGMTGDCYDCHTMHNSEEGNPVAVVDGAVSPTPISNLLKFDCLACHANDPAAGPALMTLSGGSDVPQVAHGQGMTGMAGGNFSYVDQDLGGDNRKGHTVNDMFLDQPDNNLGAHNEPPGLVHSSDRGAFTETTAFDAFTCAGARGCHGTRNQLMDVTLTQNGDGNFSTETMRVGISAVSGAHHDSYDGAKDAINPSSPAEAAHVGGNSGVAGDPGYGVADGYRFIRGLKGYGNETNRWENNAADHNEYYGDDSGMGGGCGACHIQGTDDFTGDGVNSRLSWDSTIVTPNNSMSGFCASCHGNFHSSGGGDYVDNGTSGAFLRHPSDYVIPESGEYAAYDAYDLSAPVARPTLATASSNTVTGGTDMVMCLSCHYAHASDQDYMLRFDYTAMTAGNYGDIATATAEGGCLACHTEKGVLPENR